MRGGFLMVSREGIDSLLPDTNSFLLLTQIAMRATRVPVELFINGATVHLEAGQAFIGDYRKCGLTHRGYRTAQKSLSERKLATFKPTNRGTIATLLNSSVYNINISEEANETTIERQTDDKQATTNNKLINKKNNNTTGNSVSNALEDTPERSAHEAEGETVSLPLDVPRVMENPTSAPEGKFPPDFVRFWDVYPRKDAKGNALTAWRKIKSDRELVIAGAKVFSKICQKEGVERQYIPLPSSWLNGMRWEDEKVVRELQKATPQPERVQHELGKPLTEDDLPPHPDEVHNLLDWRATKAAHKASGNDNHETAAAS